ncbi:MAG: PDZ domain-containing protein [Gammaproteobacteria bacterium]|nr:PDZ domain-containing protein [Gammaproteobacteria bacterium]
MTRQIIYGIGLLTAGTVAGALVYSSYSQLEPPSVTPDSVQHKPVAVPSAAGAEPELSLHVETLEDELNHYREWAYDLEQKVIQLDTRLNSLEEAVGSTDQGKLVVAEQEKTDDAATETQDPDEVFSVTALVGNGIDPQLAAELVRRKNRIDMQQLELRDQAIRDGTFGQEAYFEALRELNDAPNIRTELGDEAYDRYIYTLGQPNRVIVTSVIPGSPAEQFGIQAEDIILAYDDKRIFNWSELRNATTEGERGEYIQVDIRRNGQRISLPLPRGPLGIRMSNQRYNPLND